jgi:hypothetical protein
MVGLLKTAPSGFTHLLVAVDKFMKWVEAKPIRKLDGRTTLKFVKDIMVRFGIPHSIITDNGTNLFQGEVEEYCHHNGIRLDLASVAHPQSNGQVERTNRLIMLGIKPRLEAPLQRLAGAWAEELPSMLWSLQTMPNRSTGLTPFFLVYGAEAILPSDVQYDSPRVEAYGEEDAEASKITICGPARRRTRPSSPEIHHLPAESPPLSQPASLQMLIQRRGPSAMPQTAEVPQAIPSLGRTLRHQQSSTEWFLLPR